MFQKHAKKLLLTLCFSLLLFQTPAIAEAKATGKAIALETTEVQETQYSSTTKTPVKYTWKGKKLSSSFFVYRSLLSKQEKKAYDELYTNLSNGKKKTTFKTNVSTSQIHKLVQYVIYDNPEFFWVECQYEYAYSGNKVVYVTVKFNSTASNLKSNKKKFEKAVKPILKKASKAKTTIEKVKIVHDYLTRTIDYTTTAKLNQSAYSAIVHKKSVCAGYAKAFSYIMNQLGIRATYVTGYAGEDHAWNLVEIEKKWYNMDVTWDDPVGNPADNYYYDYFNLSDKQISKDHQRDSIGKVLPKCTSTKYNYENCADLFGDKDNTSNNPNANAMLGSLWDEDIFQSDDTSYTQEDLFTAFSNSPESLSKWTYDSEYNLHYYYDKSTNVFLIYEMESDCVFAITADKRIYYLDWNQYAFVEAV